ncbi:hypothetical protein DFJ73DRAFT_856469 [Zopfochytrium polystomum]|nr:hypothetical protein DFJ73DRAFT_856469 [Zopfochytrium polystomum]
MVRKKDNDKEWSAADWENLSQRAQALSQSGDHCLQAENLSAQEIKTHFPSFVKFSTAFFNRKFQEWRQKALTDRVISNIQASASAILALPVVPVKPPPAPPSVRSAAPQSPAHARKKSKKKDQQTRHKRMPRRHHHVDSSDLSDAENVSPKPPSPPRKKRQLSPLSVRSSRSSSSRRSRPKSPPPMTSAHAQDVVEIPRKCVYRLKCFEGPPKKFAVTFHPLAGYDVVATVHDNRHAIVITCTLATDENDDDPWNAKQIHDRTFKSLTTELSNQIVLAPPKFVVEVPVDCMLSDVLQTYPVSNNRGAFGYVICAVQRV